MFTFRLCFFFSNFRCAVRTYVGQRLKLKWKCALAFAVTRCILYIGSYYFYVSLLHFCFFLSNFRCAVRTYVPRTKIKIKMKMYSPSRCGEMYFIFGILLCLRFAFFHWYFRCVVRTYVGQRLKRITFWCFLLLSVFEFGVISCFSDVWFGFLIVRSIGPYVCIRWVVWRGYVKIKNRLKYEKWIWRIEE